jgi:hypothetical protein
MTVANNYVFTSRFTFRDESVNKTDPARISSFCIKGAGIQSEIRKVASGIASILRFDKHTGYGWVLARGFCLSDISFSLAKYFYRP